MSPGIFYFWDRYRLSPVALGVEKVHKWFDFGGIGCEGSPEDGAHQQQISLGVFYNNGVKPLCTPNLAPSVMVAVGFTKIPLKPLFALSSPGTAPFSTPKSSL